jgi:hypothetical protein
MALAKWKPNVKNVKEAAPTRKSIVILAIVKKIAIIATEVVKFLEIAIIAKAQAKFLRNINQKYYILTKP